MAVTDLIRRLLSQTSSEKGIEKIRSYPNGLQQHDTQLIRSFECEVKAQPWIRVNLEIVLD
jgi:hypothetical protein